MRRRDNGQGCLKPLPSGSWRWQMTLGFDETGRQILKLGTAKTKEEAQQALVLALEEHQSELLAHRMTLADWLPRWLTEKSASLTPKTAAHYRSLCTRHVMPLLGDKSLQTLNSSDVRRAYKTLAKRGLSQSLLHQVRVVLRQSLEAALRSGLVARNVADLVRLPKLNDS